MLARTFPGSNPPYRGCCHRGKKAADRPLPSELPPPRRNGRVAGLSPQQNSRVSPLLNKRAKRLFVSWRAKSYQLNQYFIDVLCALKAARLRFRASEILRSRNNHAL